MICQLGQVCNAKYAEHIWHAYIAPLSENVLVMAWILGNKGLTKTA